MWGSWYAQVWPDVSPPGGGARMPQIGLISAHLGGLLYVCLDHLCTTMHQPLHRPIPTTAIDNNRNNHNNHIKEASIISCWSCMLPKFIDTNQDFDRHICMCGCAGVGGLGVEADDEIDD